MPSLHRHRSGFAGLYPGPRFLNVAAGTDGASAYLARPRNRQAEFRVVNEAGQAPQILLYDEIGPWWMGMIDAQHVANELEQIGPVPEIHLRVNSPGGDVFEGIGIYNALKNHPARIVAYIDGLAGSTAGWIPMAADEIRIAENAFVMLHRVSAMGYGTAEELRNTADSAEQLEASIVGMFAARTGQSREQLTEWMQGETWIDGPTAVERGFADVLEPNKTQPANTAIWNSVASGRWKNLPAALKNQLQDQPANPPAGQTGEAGAARNTARQRELDLLELELHR